MATLWIVGSLSFVVALSGALMPGPLLTFTVARTVRTPRRGWLTGALVTAGHAALEGAIVLGLLFGVLEFLRTPVAAEDDRHRGRRVPRLVGRRDARRPACGRRGRRRAAAPQHAPDAPRQRHRPSTGSARCSAACSCRWPTPTGGSGGSPWGPPRCCASTSRSSAGPSWLAFFLGHEAGDLAWYLAISTLVHLGRRGIPPVAYDVLLGVCAAAVIGFGAYLGVSAWFAA